MPPKIRRRLARRVQRSPAGKGRVRHAPVFYRYVSSVEAAVIRASQPRRVPNVDLAGKPKRVYLTTHLFKSTKKAEIALRIGAFHPAGPFPSPTDRVRITLRGIAPAYVGIVPGGTATEYYTLASPFVESITPLRP